MEVEECLCVLKPLAVNQGHVELLGIVEIVLHLFGGHAELDDLGAVENLGREHVRGLVHVHRPDDKEVLGERNRRRHGRAIVGGAVLAVVELDGAVAFHCAQEVGEVTLDVGKVHLVENKEEGNCRVVVRIDHELQDARVREDIVVRVKPIRIAEQLLVVRPVCANWDDTSGVRDGDPLGECLCQLRLAAATQACKDNKRLGKKGADKTFDERDVVGQSSVLRRLVKRLDEILEFGEVDGRLVFQFDFLLHVFTPFLHDEIVLFRDEPKKFVGRDVVGIGRIVSGLADAHFVHFGENLALLRLAVVIALQRQFGRRWSTVKADL